MTHELPISSRAAAIKPSATLSVSARANELRAEGKQVLNFAAGEPDSRPPEAACRAAAEYISKEPVKYAPVPGIPQLRQAVADELGEYHGRKFTKEEVLVSCGAKHSIVNLFFATLSPGDQVVISSPYWVSYPDMIGLADGETVVVPTRLEDGWRLDPEKLEAVVGERTRFLLLNSPSNPTGAGYKAEHIRALGEVLARKAPQAWIMVDDIYRKLVYDGFEQVSAFRALEGITEQVAVVDGVSKTYAMTGFRIGFLVAPKPVIAAASRVQGQTTSNAATPSQHAAIAALTDPSCEVEVARMREGFTRRRRLILDNLAGVPGTHVHPPDGAFYVFMDVSAHVGSGTKFADDIAFAEWLLDEKLLAVVPGTAFGTAGHIRLSYATDDDSIREGCARIAEAISGLPTASG